MKKKAKEEFKATRASIGKEMAKPRMAKSARWGEVTGCLLGIADEPIPDELKHGATTAAFLIVYDQFWRVYRSGVSFWTDRSQRHDRRRSGIPRKGRLFGHPDKVSSDAQAAEVQSDRGF